MNVKNLLTSCTEFDKEPSDVSLEKRLTSINFIHHYENKNHNLAVKRRKEPSVIQSRTYITRLLPVRKHHFLEVILTVEYQ